MDRVMCQKCLKYPVQPPHRLYCSDKCMKTRVRDEKSIERRSFQYRILSRGFEISAIRLFEEAGRRLQAEDPRAWHYRLILDIVDKQPSRTPIDMERTDLRSARTIVFPEPNRRSHLDTKGIRRHGDYFTLREEFEWPAVPLAAWYRVQLLSVADLGEVIPLTPLRQQTRDLQVQLPASPYTDHWRSPSWGKVRQHTRRPHHEAPAKEADAKENA